MLRALFKRIPYAESLRSFLEQWGLWPILGYAISFVAAVAVSVWAWLESHLPYWAIACVFLAVFAGLLFAINQGYGFIVKRKQSRLIDQVVTIDRESLANELEEISRKIAALVGEFRGPMQEAWWKESMNRDPGAVRASYARIEGQLIEKYSYRHAADVWRLIRRAMKVTPIDRGELWQIQHGARSEHDMMNIYMFLAALADDVRSPKQTLPMTDHRMRIAAARAAVPSPQSPPSIEGKTPQ